MYFYLAVLYFKYVSKEYIKLYLQVHQDKTQKQLNTPLQKQNKS